MAYIDEVITIQASAQTVWQVLTQFEAYPQWHPFISQLQQAPESTETDQQFSWMVTQQEQPQLFDVTIEQWNPSERLSLIQSKADSTAEQSIREDYAIQVLTEESCELKRRIEFVGFSWMFGLFLKLFYQRQNIDEEDVLEAIQKRAEAFPENS